MILDLFAESASKPRIQAVVINLDRNRDRLLHFTFNYKMSDISKDIPLRRFPAFDAKNMDISRYVTPKTLQQIQETEKTGFRLRHHEMTPGAVGCFLSHVAVMRMFMFENEKDVLLIFEDDAEIPASLKASIYGTLRDAPDDWDLIVLGYHYAIFDEKGSTEALDRLKTFWGTHAVLVNKKGARKVVEDYEANLISMQIDSNMSVMLKQGRLVAYATRPQYVRPADFATDIQVPVQTQQGINPFTLESFLASFRTRR
jgi:GR25 family glycosyltransferase involved in LPS biosynthesis